MIKNLDTLTNGLTKSFSAHAERNALCINDVYYKYSEVESHSFLIASLIQKSDGENSPYVVIFGYRSLHTYTGILGTLLAGRAYLPLNPSFPTSRLKTMLERSGCKILILSEECADAFSEVGKVTQGFTVICPEPGEKIVELIKKNKHHDFVLPNKKESILEKKYFRDVNPDDPAYLLFTSGSTGIPKGVVVSHKNVCSYLTYTIDRYQVSNDDRVSQMFDITFDLSVHDIFISFLSGACLYVVPGSSVMAPAKFIKDKQLTLWFSVPSVAMFMERMRMLKPESFLSLRYSLFCGEAFPQKTAEAWQLASPNSIIENLYGPTEATIAITNYTWDSKNSPSECINGIVPIGKPFDGQQIIVVKNHNEIAQKMEKGELGLSGSQVTAGYLNDLEKTAERFVNIDDSDFIYYLTGDLVYQNEDDILIYIGRTDDQLQIRGYRVELQEIDHVIRKGAGTDLAISVPRLLAPGQAESVNAVIEGDANDFSVENIMKYCKDMLPEYMVPSRIEFVESMPLNANGKINRKILIEGELV